MTTRSCASWPFTSLGPNALTITVKLPSGSTSTKVFGFATFHDVQSYGKLIVAFQKLVEITAHFAGVTEHSDAVEAFQ